MELVKIISIVIASLSFLIDGVITTLLLIHFKRGHKLPNATKIELKKKKQEIKATYVAARKALKNVKNESGKK